MGKLLGVIGIFAVTAAIIVGHSLGFTSIEAFAGIIKPAEERQAPVPPAAGLPKPAADAKSAGVKIVKQAQTKSLLVMNAEPADKALRIALVVGNSAYQQAPLESPVNDAKAMKSTLQQLGFYVIGLENATAAEMVIALREFGDTLKDTNSIGLFYFAGHGVQIEGENYLIPVGIDIQREYEVKYQALNLNRILDEMGRNKNRANVVILDACRNNPFTNSTRSLPQGLAPLNRVDNAGGVLVAYATAPGHVAIDGDDYGLYTKHLLTYMNQPDLPVEQVFKRVRNAVIAETQGQQVPWENSSLTADFYFNPVSVQSAQFPDTAPLPATPSARIAAPAPPTKPLKLQTHQLKLGPAL